MWNLNFENKNFENEFFEIEILQIWKLQKTTANYKLQKKLY